MADFIAEIPQFSQLVKPSREGWWIFHVNEASRALGSRVSLLLQLPTGEQLEQAIRLGFLTSNNEAIMSELSLALALLASQLEIHSDSQLIVRHIQGEYEAKDGWMA